MKVGVITSCGGHLAEIRAVRKAFTEDEHFYVLNDRAILPDDMKGRTHFVAHSERDLKFLLNLAEAWKILREERPQVLLSAGAGVIVPFTLVAKLLGIRCVFVETAAQIERPSLTGRIMYLLADRFFYQWPELRRWFPRGDYCGPTIWSS